MIKEEEAATAEEEPAYGAPLEWEEMEESEPESLRESGGSNSERYDSEEEKMLIKEEDTTLDGYVKFNSVVVLNVYRPEEG